jgi:hypothetical protein
MATPSTTLSPEELQILLNGPAATPPAGVVPNFDDPPTLDAIIIPILTLCLTLATLAVLARAYTKLFIIRSIAYEDCKSPYFDFPSCNHTEHIRRSFGGLGMIQFD